MGVDVVNAVMGGREACRVFVFFFNDTATTEIYTLPLHDALPILRVPFVGFVVVRAVQCPERLFDGINIPNAARANMYGFRH